MVIANALSVEAPLTRQGSVIYRRPSSLSLTLLYVALSFSSSHSVIPPDNEFVLRGVEVESSPPLKVVTPIWSNGVAERKP